MFRKFTLSFILTVCALVFGKNTFAATIIDNGTNNNYSLTAADSLVITLGGTYTGNITAFPTGAKITVIGTFQPNNFPNAGGKLYVYGTAIFNMAVNTTSGFTLNNYGTVSFNSTVDINISGSNQAWTNYYGALINFAADATIRSNNILTNYGTITAGGDFDMRGTAQVINYNNIIVAGTFEVNGGTLDNKGKLHSIGLLNFNNGTSLISNYCSMSSLGGIRNTSNFFYNYSYLWARNDNGLGAITNSGIIYNQSWAAVNQSMPIIHGRSVSNTGTITGKGYLYFYGTTSQTGGGITGAAGVTTDTLKMYDITRASPSTIYDVQGSSVVYPNAIYNAWGIPDSLRAYLIGCSLEIVLFEFPLAINWNFFEVNLSNNIPVLNWSAEFTEGTVFEIQRSYDGRNFSSINVLPYEAGQSGYEYKDRMVNTQAPIVYYRIKSNEISGVEKYTQTKIVKFNNKPGSIYTAPNPFTNNFIINYRASERETLTIRMFNVSGQQMLVKNVTVDEGNNNINITEASQLAKGIYVIQVNKGYNMISSSKIIKQ